MEFQSQNCTIYSIRLYFAGADSPPNERSDGAKTEGELYRQLSKHLIGSDVQGLGNELSAPYEVPQFPIEQIQSKLNR